VTATCPELTQLTLRVHRPSRRRQQQLKLCLRRAAETAGELLALIERRDGYAVITVTSMEAGQTVEVGRALALFSHIVRIGSTNGLQLLIPWSPWARARTTIRRPYMPKMYAGPSVSRFRRTRRHPIAAGLHHPRECACFDDTSQP
jgi:hypothetical protein